MLEGIYLNVLLRNTLQCLFVCDVLVIFCSVPVKYHNLAEGVLRRIWENKNQLKKEHKEGGYSNAKNPSTRRGKCDKSGAHIKYKDGTVGTRSGWQLGDQTGRGVEPWLEQMRDRAKEYFWDARIRGRTVTMDELYQKLEGYYKERLRVFEAKVLFEPKPHKVSCPYC